MRFINLKTLSTFLLSY